MLILIFSWHELFRVQLDSSPTFHGPSPFFFIDLTRNKVREIRNSLRAIHESKEKRKANIQVEDEENEKGHNPENNLVVHYWTL